MTTPTPARRTAVVTGATSGIGAEVAVRLAHDGFFVVATGRDPERGREIATRLGDSGAFVGAELTATGAVESLFDEVLALTGRLDVVVNNAALDHTGDLLEVPADEVRRVFDVNVFAAVEVLQAGARRMPNGGAIINLTSRLASVGVPTMAIYSASKGALAALTTAAAVELAPRGIRVNAVAPGMTRTPLYDAWLADQSDPPGVEEDVRRAIPLGRLAQTADVAGAVSYLASDDAAYVTGITIPVDGGYTAQ